MDFADVELPGSTEESEDLGSMEMKPMGKAAFMSLGVGGLVIRRYVCGMVWDE